MTVPARTALSLHVSAPRQAEYNVSIPDQSRHAADPHEHGVTFHGRD